MIPGDWSKMTNFVGSVILFYASYRNQAWARVQSVLEERAAAQVQAGRIASAAGSARADHSPEEFATTAAELAARPFFDRRAYQLLCLGFLLSSIAAFLDMYDSGTFQHLLGHSSATSSMPAPSAQDKLPAAAPPVPIADTAAQ